VPSKYESQIDHLKGLQKKESELKGAISNCDSFIRLIQAKPSKDGLTVGKPRIKIEVADDYSDGDYWARVELSFERDKLDSSIIDAIIRLVEDKKNELTVELHDLP